MALTCLLSVKRSFLKVKNFLFFPFFYIRQKWILHKLKSKDRAVKINKFIYLKIAYYKNHPYYDEVVLYAKLMLATWFVMWFVVLGYKYGRYSVLLGASIAVTIALAQYYLEWWYKLRKKYQLK